MNYQDAVKALQDYLKEEYEAHKEDRRTERRIKQNLWRNFSKGYVIPSKRLPLGRADREFHRQEFKDNTLHDLAHLGELSIPGTSGKRIYNTMLRNVENRLEDVELQLRKILNN